MSYGFWLWVKKMNKWTCNVLNCGNGTCVHKVLDERCPRCGYKLVLVTTSGLKFCSNFSLLCEYEREPDEQTTSGVDSASIPERCN